ncbi:hypothetical protein F511_09705, partial [Dorcoceras hygrometricum]
KTRLQEYAQRAGVQLPVYQTLNEGPPHACQFKSQVLLDGIWYTSPNSFLCRKMAEHDAAKHAFIGFREKLKAEGRSLVLEDVYFCKAIMNEYAVKMNMSLPTYVTNESKAFLPIFVSSLLLNGVTFTGDAARSKKEAEQFAARSAILSILVSEAGTTMSELLKSKSKFYNAVKLAKDSSSIQASLVNAKDSSRIQASSVKDSSIIPAPTVKDSSIIPAPAVNDPSIIPAPAVKDPSIIPALGVKDPSIVPAPTVKDPSTVLAPAINISAFAINDSSNNPACNVKDSPMIPACIAKNSSTTPISNFKDSSSIPACVVKDPTSMPDSANIHVGPAATEAVPLDSAVVFTSTKEVDVGVSAIKDALATLRQPSFAPFPSLQLAHSESASEQPSHSQSAHQSLHLFKKPKTILSAEDLTPPIEFVPPTLEQASESPPVCTTSGKRRRKNKKAKKNALYQSPSTIVMEPQNQVPAFQ